MDWNALRTFLAVAKAGSLSSAAKSLKVNHSTIFRRLNAFEENIGTRLFDRLNDGYRLTQAGEDLQIRAEVIANAFDGLERHIAGQDFSPKGLVRITSANNIAYQFLPAYITDFERQYPDIEIELLVSNQDFDLTRREADIAIRATPNPPEHLVGRKIVDVGWGVYASQDYINQHEAISSLLDLSSHSLIGGAGSMSNLPAFRWAELNAQQNVKIRCNDLVSMSSLAASGFGLAILPDDQIRSDLVRIMSFAPGKYSSLWLLTHPDLRQVERVKLLSTYLTNKFREDERITHIIKLQQQ